VWLEMHLSFRRLGSALHTGPAAGQGSDSGELLQFPKLALSFL
jgi:hypothetical protein